MDRMPERRRGLVDRIVIAGIAAWLVGIELARALTESFVVNIALLSVFAVVAAAYRFGTAGALLAALAATALFVLDRVALGVALDDAIVGSAATRLIVYAAIGVLLARLFARERALTTTVTSQHGEIVELGAIRQALLPADARPVEGVRVELAFVPSGLAGGDFSLVAGHHDGRVTVCVGDVTGHGEGAAARATYMRATLLALADQTADSGELLRLANAATYDVLERAGELAAVTCVRVDPAAGRMDWASAGQSPPWLAGTDAPLTDRADAPPLGVAPAMRVTARTRDLAPGEVVLLFSDGLPDAAPKGGAERLGETAVHRAITGLHDRDPHTAVETLRDLALRHSHGRPTDDLTIAAIALDPVAAPPAPAAPTAHHARS